jgi:hypothetical protein
MTAQTVIMNKLCACVSSDSSVTLSGSDGTRRTFPTAEKITPLPPPHSILILHSGATDVLNVPYSVLLGEWIRTLPDAPLDKVSDYRVHLESWIIEQKGLFTPEAQSQYLTWILREKFLAVRTRILDQCHQQKIEPAEWGNPPAAAIVEEAITSSLDALSRQPRLQGWEDVDCAAIIHAHQAQLDEAREWVFDDTPRSKGGDAKLTDLAAAVLGAFEPHDRDAVLTFVGYSVQELFPASEKANIQGILEGRLRTAPPESTIITTDMDSGILPLGQTEAVNTFLRAYNSTFLVTAHARLDQFLTDAKKLVSADSALEGQLEQLGDEAGKALDADFNDLSWKEFIQPMLNTVAALPPAEVARMAESLVGLQVLRQLTQADAETVGGPIDVAIVTRHEGVRWIRHKSLVPGGSQTGTVG